MNAFLPFIVVLFVLAVLLRVDFFFTILYLFVGLYIVLRLWTERVFGKLEIRRAFADRAFIGDTIDVTLTVKNGSRLPLPWLLIHESIPWSLSTVDAVQRVITLSGRETQRIEYQLRALRRGYYRVGPLSVSAGDLLGMRRSLNARLSAGYLIVYPKVLPMPDLGLPAHSPQAILLTATPIFEDPARITGLRSYQWGDNPRHIHWPATARLGQVTVKQFQPAIARESVIFLNLARQDYHRHEREFAMELAITVAASLASHMLLNEKLPVGLDIAAMDPLAEKTAHFSLPPGKDQNQLMQILEVLARVQPIDDGGFLENLRQQAVHLSWGATIAVVTGAESPELVHTLMWLKQTGFSPSLTLVGEDVRPQLSAQAAIPVFDVRRPKDVEIWQARS